MSVAPRPVQDQSSTSWDWNWLRLVSQPWKTNQNCPEPVDVSSVQSFVVRQYVRTGPGLSLVKFGQKTGPDRTFKHYPYVHLVS